MNLTKHQAAVSLLIITIFQNTQILISYPTYLFAVKMGGGEIPGLSSREQRCFQKQDRWQVPRIISYDK